MVKPTICSKTYRSSADGEIFYDVLESLIVEKISPFEDSKFGICHSLLRSNYDGGHLIVFLRLHQQQPQHHRDRHHHQR